MLIAYVHFDDRMQRTPIVRLFYKRTKKKTKSGRHYTRAS